jgi:hypothetical protein
VWTQSGFDFDAVGWTPTESNFNPTGWVQQGFHFES